MSSRPTVPDLIAALQEAEATIANTLQVRGYRQGQCTDDWSPEVRREVATLASIRAPLAKAGVSVGDEAIRRFKVYVGRSGIPVGGVLAADSTEAHRKAEQLFGHLATAGNFVRVVEARPRASSRSTIARLAAATAECVAGFDALLSDAAMRNDPHAAPCR